MRRSACRRAVPARHEGRTARRALLSSPVALAAGAAALGVPGPALAHATDRALVMLLPTDYYLVGGALTVGLTFAIMTLVPVDRLRALFAAGDPPGAPGDTAPGPGGETARGAVSWLSFLAFLGLLYSGVEGTRDPLANPLPLTVWTLFWVALALAHAVFGNLFAWLNPWTGPVRTVRRMLGRAAAPPPLRLPAAVGHAPAILALFAVAWFELVDIAPDDPFRLAVAAGAYWAVMFAAMLLFGEETWRARGEAFSVFFRFVAMLAPVGRDGAGRLRLCVPGARILAAPAPTTSAALFVLCALATVSFDGLNKTFWWLDVIGVNPLEFPGRSAVIGENTVGLLGAFAALGGSFFVVVHAGARLVGVRGAAAGAGALVLSLLPISLAYHFSHYLVVLLVNAQYALVALNDPLGTGADLLGLGHLHVKTSFLTSAKTVPIIWNLQAGAIIIGHVWAVILAHAVAAGYHGTARRAAISQGPLALLMVGYTVFGLWLLSAPTGA